MILVTTGSDNGLSPFQRQAFTGTNADFLLIKFETKRHVEIVLFSSVRKMDTDLISRSLQLISQ